MAYTRTGGSALSTTATIAASAPPPGPAPHPTTPVQATDADSDHLYSPGDLIRLIFDVPIDFGLLNLDNFVLADGRSLGDGVRLVAVDDALGFATTVEITLGDFAAVAWNDTITIDPAELVDENGDHAAVLAVFTLPPVESVPPAMTAATLPADRWYVTGDHLDFTVTFSETVTVTGAPAIPLVLDSGGTVLATCVGGDGTGTLAFRYTVGGGVKDATGITVGASLDLTGGTIRDIAGNAVSPTLLPAGIGGVRPGIRVDGTEPGVTGVTSTTANGFYKAGDTIAVAVTFSGAVAVAGTPALRMNTGHDAVFTGGAGTDTLTFAYTVQPGDNTADLDCAGPAALTGAILTDADSGRAVPATLPAPGTPGSLGSNKAIVLDTAASGLAGAVVVGGTLVLTYDDALDGASDPDPGAYGVVVDGRPVSVLAANAEGRTVTLFLAEAVAAGQTVTIGYTVPETSPVRDPAGNPVAALAGLPVGNATPIPEPTTPIPEPTTPTTPVEPTVPADPSTVIVDGMPVTTRTGTGGDGAPARIVEMPVVPPDRKDTVGNPDLADIPLVRDGDGNALLAIGLPTGVGVHAEGPIAPGAGDLIGAIAARTAGADQAAERAEMTAVAQRFLDGLPAGTTLLVRTIVPVMAAEAAQTPARPIVVTASAATAQTGNGGAPEAVVFDGRGLPPGTVIDLDGIAFAAILGPVTVRGGTGSQTATGSGAAQVIVLGAGDDVLHGGAGDDVVGSQGGNDRIFGDEGDDRLFGGQGNDTIDGGSGFDVVRFTGKAADFTAARNTDGSITVTGEGTDVLANVELLRFDDGVRLTDVPKGPMGAVDEAFYLARNADVAAAVKAGLFTGGAQHFALFGAAEGRDPSAFFSTAWYLAQNADVAAAVKAGLTSAWDHYNQFGWTEDRDASVWFDTSEYLKANPDVAAAGVNPLLHLLGFGLREGRLAHADDGDLWG